MQWSDVLGHDEQQRWFQTALANGRLATSFLFVGQSGIGKTLFATLLAKGLLCRGTDANEIEFCSNCEDCAQVDAGTHPDVIRVCKPADRAFLPIELLIGEREKRNREGLCHDISLRPFAGRRKIAILEDADYLNVEGANCLLKTLEEPPNHSILILVGTGLQRQLPTIRSRCQSILFRPLSDANLAILLKKNGLVESESEANDLALQSGGSLDEARSLLDPEIREFQSALLEMLSRPKHPILELVKSCSAIVDSAGKDARIKRERMKSLLQMASAFYRCLAVCLTSQERLPGANPQVYQVAERTVGHWRGGVDGATECWKRCLEAMEQVERNANQAALLEAWSADLAQLARA